MTFGDDVTRDDSLREAGNKILNAHHAGDMVVACCTCTVEYIGTVESNLPPEKRTVLLKPDDSLLVHSAEGVDPVNWQKSGSTIRLRLRDDALVMKAIDGDEELIVKCFTIHKSIHYKPPTEDVKSMVGTEDDMHAAILETPGLIEDGLTRLEHEKEISSGSIDVFGQDREGRPTVIEVKRRKAQLKHVDQLKRYVDTLRKNNENVRGILVAPEISQSAATELEDKSLEFCALNPLEIAQTDTDNEN